MSNPLNDVAPWPKTGGEATDEAVLRTLMVDAYAAYWRARLKGRRAFAGKSKNPGAVAEYAASVDTLAGWFVSVFLLRSFRDGADLGDTARQVWRFLGDEGLDMGEFLFDWLREAGLDPRAVERAVIEGEAAA